MRIKSFHQITRQSKNHILEVVICGELPELIISESFFEKQKGFVYAHKLFWVPVSRTKFHTFPKVPISLLSAVILLLKIIIKYYVVCCFVHT